MNKFFLCRFSPRFNSCSVGWEATEKPPPRQDFALFMKFEMVGSNESFLSENISRNFEFLIFPRCHKVIASFISYSFSGHGQPNVGILGSFYLASSR